MVWGAIGYNVRSCLVHSTSNLNSNRYIWEVVELEVLPLLRYIPGDVFQQDNAYAHVSQMHYRLRFFHGQHIPQICLPFGISLVGDLLVQLVGYIIRINFGFKSKPSGMPFPRITYRACIIQCHDVCRLSSLSMVDIQSTDFRRSFCFFLL